MRVVLVLLAAFAAIDLLVCGAVLAAAWAAYRRVRRAARIEGRPVPPPATTEFVLLALFGLAGIAVLYGSIWFLLGG